MTTQAEMDARNMEEIKAMLRDPKMGINEPSRRAITQLFEHVILKKKVDPDVLQRWRQLGRLTKDDAIPMTDQENFFDLELALLALEWENKIEFVTAKPTATSK